MKEMIRKAIAASMDELFEISEFLYSNPETGGEEYKAAGVLSNKLENEGFHVKRNFCSLETAFKATLDSGKKGETIAFLCEYDALPEIGHACGHNLIAAMSIGAAMGLKSVINDVGGKIVVYGTPAEETDGAKVQLVNQGAFDGITAAMMVHPSPVSEESGTSLALNALRFRYFGKAAHAAASPEAGISALDAVLALFGSVNALRQFVRKDVSIHGIITKGGTVPNIVPDFAEALFYVRAADKETLEQVTERVRDCARGAEMMTGARLELTNFEATYDNLKTNRTLSALFNKNLSELGEGKINPPGKGHGSIDMGNVSHVVPAIHPWIGFGNEKLTLHTKEFAEYTMKEDGKMMINRGACAMAMTAYDVMSSENTAQRIKEEFASF
jgi:amidohydrolase